MSRDDSINEIMRALGRQEGILETLVVSVDRVNSEVVGLRSDVSGVRHGLEDEERERLALAVRVGAVEKPKTEGRPDVQISISAPAVKRVLGVVGTLVALVAAVGAGWDQVVVKIVEAWVK